METGRQDGVAALTADAQPEAQECVICLDPLRNEEDRLLQGCPRGHMFHTDCLARNPNHSCPLCRYYVGAAQEELFDGTMEQESIEIELPEFILNMLDSLESTIELQRISIEQQKFTIQEQGQMLAYKSQQRISDQERIKRLASLFMQMKGQYERLLAEKVWWQAQVEPLYFERFLIDPEKKESDKMGDDKG